MADAESAEADRPSFSTFWKRVKQKEKGDDQQKKGKKTASPSSTAELQAEDEGDEQDQDPGESR